MNFKLKRSRDKVVKITDELTEVKHSYADTRKIRLEARKIKATSTAVIIKEKQLRKNAEVKCTQHYVLKSNALQRARQAIKQKEKSNKLAHSRLTKLQILRNKNTLLNDELMIVKNRNGQEFKKVRDVSSDGKPGGGLVWPLWVL